MSESLLSNVIKCAQMPQLRIRSTLPSHLARSYFIACCGLLQACQPALALQSGLEAQIITAPHRRRAAHLRWGLRHYVLAPVRRERGGPASSSPLAGTETGPSGPHQGPGSNFTLQGQAIGAGPCSEPAPILKGKQPRLVLIGWYIFGS